MSNDKQGTAMFNEQWKWIAEAASRVNAVSACDEVINIARDHGINIRADDSPIYPTVLVAGNPMAIMITPRLFAPSPEIAVTVLGHIYPIKDLLESRGYLYSELGWIKRFKIEVDGDEALILAIFSAVEEALLVLKSIILSSLSVVEKSLLVLAELKTRSQRCMFHNEQGTAMTNAEVQIIRVRKCWECGCLRALNRADEPTLDAVWRRAREIRDELCRNGASISDAWRQAWQQAQEEAGVQVQVAFRYYCGC
jgi:hypothetical protein